MSIVEGLSPHHLHLPVPKIGVIAERWPPE
jgi:hypothetical protein